MKTCNRCKQSKAFTEFYLRSGRESGNEPQHFSSECKDCMKERSRITHARPINEAYHAAENIVIRKLRDEGIWAQPGKAIASAYVDVVAWGCVRIEVKYSRKTVTASGAVQYKFDTTARQRQRHMLADVVILVCDTGDESYSFHVFTSSDPIFYRDGQLKVGWTYTPEQYRKKAPTNGAARQSITDAVMLAAQDRFEMIEEVRRTWFEREQREIA